jgi:class 3 adenylate cyclase
VGIDYGNVIVTKIGISQIFDVKAFGDCINKASHYSNECNKIKVSKAVYNLWPEGKNGKIRFTGNDDDGYIILRG